MRWVPLCALLLIAALPAAPQDGDDSGIEEDSQPTGPEEPEEEPEPEAPDPPPEKPPADEAPSEDGFTPPSAEEVNRAIDLGIAWLKKAQQETGSWGPCVSGATYGKDSGGGPCYHLGPTAFAVFTLATCGVPRDDPAIRKGLAWVEKTGGSAYKYTSYESSAVILMLAAVSGTAPPANGRKLPRSGGRPPKGSGFKHDDWKRMDDRVRHLLENLQAKGGFGYWVRKPGYADVSATQFAILALRAASFAGYPVEKVKPDVWARTAGYLEGLQAGSGGFPYHNPYSPSPGMTAAALSSLLICREQLALRGERASALLDDAIARGLAYLEANLDVTKNPSSHRKGNSAYHYCHLYAIERTGILSARRELGGKDWYTRGAAWLLSQQGADGCWDDDTCMDPEDTLGTCFALLFLKRATPPAVTSSGG